LRLNVDRRPERAVLVAVDRLQNRLAATQVNQMLGDHVDVVALRMPRRDPQLAPLPAVVAVVVVRADVGDVVLAEHTHEPTGDGRLARRRVADDAEDYGTRVHPNTLLFRMSCDSIRTKSS